MIFLWAYFFIINMLYNYRVKVQYCAFCWLRDAGRHGTEERGAVLRFGNDPPLGAPAHRKAACLAKR